MYFFYQDFDGLAEDSAPNLDNCLQKSLRQHVKLSPTRILRYEYPISWVKGENKKFGVLE